MWIIKSLGVLDDLIPNNDRKTYPKRPRRIEYQGCELSVAEEQDVTLKLNTD